MVRNLKNKPVIIHFLITIFMLFFVYFYKLSFSKINYKKIMKQNEPNYQNMYKEIKDEYNLLFNEYNFIPAEVIHQNMMPINNIFLINQGKANGIKEETFVVNEKGLVGLVLKTFDNFSIVNSLKSSNINIAVEVNECYGLLKSSYNLLVIDDIVKCPNIKIGDPVFTSKYNYSSSNILVGYITKHKDNKYYVSTTVDPFQVRYVGVINDNN